MKRAIETEDGLPDRVFSDCPSGLCDREIEVLDQVATSLTNAETGEVLCISPRTVA